MKYRTTYPSVPPSAPLPRGVWSVVWLLFGLWAFQGSATFEASPTLLSPQETYSLGHETDGATALSPDWVWEEEESSIDLIDDADDDEAHGEASAERCKTAPSKYSSTCRYLRTSCANIGTVPLYILYRQMKAHLA